MPIDSQSTSSLPLPALLEAVLYAHGGTMTHKALTDALECDMATLLRALHDLDLQLKGRGLALLHTETQVSLRTSPEAAALLEKINKDRFAKDIGPAGLEVLAIVLYRGPSTRAVIDYIRGVNSAATLRLLSARGLIEGTREKGGEMRYAISTESLAHLGILQAEDLPEYATLKHTIETYERSAEPTITGDDADGGTGAVERPRDGRDDRPPQPSEPTNPGYGRDGDGPHPTPRHFASDDGNGQQPLT